MVSHASWQFTLYYDYTIKSFFEAWIDVLYILCSIQVLGIVPMFVQ